MLSGKTSKASVIETTSWIWSKWLQEQARPRLEYQHFTHFEFIEDETKRAEVADNLARLLYAYHTSSPVNTNLLVQMKYRRLASALTKNIDQRPRDNTTRSGNLVEILACEFAKTQGYDIPVLRLQYNPNPNQSMKGDDILGFHFCESSLEPDALIVGEGKFRSKFETQAVAEAHGDLKRKIHSSPISMEFVATILALEGNQPMAAKIRQLHRRIVARDKSVLRQQLLFLGTVGQPQDPFEYLEELGGDLFPHLIAVNIVFKQGFRSWIEEVYEKEYWN